MGVCVSLGWGEGERDREPVGPLSRAAWRWWRYKAVDNRALAPGGREGEFLGERLQLREAALLQLAAGCGDLCHGEVR